MRSQSSAVEKDSAAAAATFIFKIKLKPARPATSACRDSKSTRWSAGASGTAHLIGAWTNRLTIFDKPGAGLLHAGAWQFVEDFRLLHQQHILRRGEIQLLRLRHLLHRNLHNQPEIPGSLEE